MAFFRSLSCPLNFNYSISGGVLLESTGESVNDLGITFYRCLKFNDHLDKTLVKP